MESTYFAIAFLSGIIPALFWVWFWLREDARKPEPYFLIAISFIGGMAVVPLVFPLQKAVLDLYPATDSILTGISHLIPLLQEPIQNLISRTVHGTDTIIMWVLFEELLKYAAAIVLIFWNREVDEPIDMVIYLIVIALGFAALENALFIFNPLALGSYFDSALTGSFRFLGATLLHVLASGTIGIALALAYYKSRFIQLLAGMTGLFIAVVLHALFNFFIMNANGETILLIFLFVWMGIVVMFLLFEKIKFLERNYNRKRTWQ
jgi:RsiW-degrading membrane proteinase PrsW (M82 family)